MSFLKHQFSGGKDAAQRSQGKTNFFPLIAFWSRAIRNPRKDGVDKGIGGSEGKNVEKLQDKSCC